MEAYADDIKPLSYSGKEWVIAVILMPPFAILLNFVLFGIQYFSSLKNFLIPTGITLCVITLVYVCCGMGAEKVISNPLYKKNVEQLSNEFARYKSNELVVRFVAELLEPLRDTATTIRE